MLAAPPRMVFLMTLLRLSDTEQLAQSHTAHRWQREDLNLVPGSGAPTSRRCLGVPTPVSHWCSMPGGPVTVPLRWRGTRVSPSVGGQSCGTQADCGHLEGLGQPKTEDWG